ncbi:MAG: uracil-DNA glycosylase [Alphaproteobacteria bacterium]|nr:uracil-DNA glycosylase [Alphaproteobacteria bacterium]
MSQHMMKNYSLQDLILSGVKWELLDEPATHRMHKIKNNNESTAINSTLRVSDSPAVPMAPVISTSDALEYAQAAAMATDNESLCAAIKGCNHPLRAFAKTISPHLSGRIVIITDSPSSDDDESGKILSGAAGDLLDKMMTAIGLSRDQTTIIPLVFWRPAGGRTPTREELDLARPFVDRAISLSAPKVILTLGTLAAAEIAGAALPKQHGETIKCKIQNADVKAIPIFHPNYILLKPDAKKPVWEALQKLLQILNEKVE